MNKEIENIIKKFVLSKEIDVINQKNQSSDALSMSHGYNKGLSEIYHSNIADEVLKVVVERIKKLKINKVGLNKKMSDDRFYDRLELNRDISKHNQTINEVIKLLSNLSHNKENKK